MFFSLFKKRKKKKKKRKIKDRKLENSKSINILERDRQK